MKVFMLAFKMNLVNNLSCENVVTCVKSYKDFFFHFDELYACSIFVESWTKLSQVFTSFFFLIALCYHLMYKELVYLCLFTCYF